MIVELINTGSELMLGFTLNTHQQWLCRRMADLGCPVSRQVTIPDTASAIQTAVREALTRADLVITTGGLGPTADDLTRTTIADLLGKRLGEAPSVVTHIEQFFAARKRPMPPQTRVQALVPEGATVLLNRFGTAPGLVMTVPQGHFRTATMPGTLIMLPGPPRELHPMFNEQVIPLLQQKTPPQLPFVCRTYRTTGLGESMIEEKIAPALAALTANGLELAYCGRIGEVDVRIVARGANAERIAVEAEKTIQERIGRYIFCCGDDSLEAVVIRHLTERRETLALAESCTGGLVSHRITNVPGASAVFLAGFITYSNEAKEQMLGVRPETLAQFGAVSEATAKEMAEGARARAGATYAIGITGIAGPTGGTLEKPAGTVYIACAAPRKTMVLSPLNPHDRETFKWVTSQQALELLRRHLI